jgi:hypothetical protein
MRRNRSRKGFFTTKDTKSTKLKDNYMLIAFVSFVIFVVRE